MLLKLTLLKLNERLRQAKKDIISIAVHPGYTATNLQSDKFPLWKLNNDLLTMKVEKRTEYYLFDDDFNISFHQFDKYNVFENLQR